MISQLCSAVVRIVLSYGLVPLPSLTMTAVLIARLVRLIINLYYLRMIIGQGWEKNDKISLFLNFSQYCFNSLFQLEGIQHVLKHWGILKQVKKSLVSMVKIFLGMVMDIVNVKRAKGKSNVNKYNCKFIKYNQSNWILSQFIMHSLNEYEWMLFKHFYVPKFIICLFFKLICL